MLRLYSALTILLCGAISLSACAPSGIKQGESPALKPQLQGMSAAEQSQSVPGFVETTEVQASGRAEYVIVTDRDRHSLLAQSVPRNGEIKLALPADGVLLISTRWSEGRVNQIVNVLESGAKPYKAGTQVMLSLNKKTKFFEVELPVRSQQPRLDTAVIAQGKPAVAAPVPAPVPDLTVSKQKQAAVTPTPAPEKKVSKPDKPATPGPAVVAAPKEIKQDTPPAAVPPRGLVSVKDGAGQTLYSGVFAEELELDATDGTLLVSISQPDGSTSSQQISYGDHEVFVDYWDEFVVLAWDASARKYVIRPRNLGGIGPTPMRSIRLMLGRDYIEDKAPSIGVITGSDEPLLFGADEIDLKVVNLGVSLGKWGGYRPTLGLGLGRGDGSEERVLSGSISGWAFQEELSPGGSTGVAAAGGASASLETDSKMESLSLKLSSRSKHFMNLSTSTDFNFGIRRSVRDYSGTVKLTAFTDVNSTDDQKITQYDVSAGMGATGSFNLTRNLAAGAGIGLDLVYFRSEYDGDHHYICAPCVSSDQNFSQSGSDTENGITWGGRLSGNLGYKLGRSGDLVLGAEYHYLNKVPMLRNRVRPADNEPSLHNVSADGYAVMLGVSINR